VGVAVGVAVALVISDLLFRLTATSILTRPAPIVWRESDIVIERCSHV
jgi:hypothetical protein